MLRYRGDGQNLVFLADSSDPNYVTAGSRIRWTATGSITGLTSYATAWGNLLNAIRGNSGFYNVADGGSGHTLGAGLGISLGTLADDYSMAVELSSSIDRDSINDIMSDLISIANGQGWTIYDDTTINFISRAAPGTTPTAPLVQSGAIAGGGGGVGTGVGGGVSGTTLIIGAIALLFFLRR